MAFPSVKDSEQPAVRVAFCRPSLPSTRQFRISHHEYRNYSSIESNSGSLGRIGKHTRTDDVTLESYIKSRQLQRGKYNIQPTHSYCTCDVRVELEHTSWGVASTARVDMSSPRPVVHSEWDEGLGTAPTLSTNLDPELCVFRRW